LFDFGQNLKYQVDIWSLGITCIELAKQKPPNSHLPPLRVLSMIPMQPPPRLKGDQFSEEFRNFVEQCLQKDASTVRFSLSLICARPIMDSWPSNHLIFFHSFKFSATQSA
jgi:serine/threonine protein kinase